MDGGITHFMVALALGIGLAATAGIRAFYPLLAVSVLAHLGWLPFQLNDGYAWLGSWPALFAFSCAAVLEFLGDKFPVIDHILHGIGLIAAPLAGTVVAASSMSDASPVVATLVGLIAGGAPALTVHAGRSVLRGISTATTAGLGNPAISVGEDAVAVAGIGTAFFLPFVAAFLAISLFALCVYALVVAKRRFSQKKRPASPAAPPAEPSEETNAPA
jgi:uncharacterized membrane protein